MRLSHKLEYALRALAQIAAQYGSGNLAHIEELADSEEIPQNYLIQILNDLRVGGILRSKRGKAGGYKLAKPPAEISLYAIISIIDPEMLRNHVQIKGASGPRLAEVWGNVAGSVKEVLNNIPLSTLTSADEVRDWAI